MKRKLALAAVPLLALLLGGNVSQVVNSVAISTGVTGLGTGIATALGINTGSAGAPVLFNGALGTPSSGTLTNATGLPLSGLTGSAWSTSTPSPTCGTGTPTTITTALGVSTVVKTTTFSITFTLTNIGTCSGVLSVTLPATANRATVFPAFNNVAGTGKFASIAAGSATLSVYTTAFAFPGVNSDTITVSGVFENQ